ncbi:hypothetical protein RJ640_012230 [Escallonia rubra]|uniref:NB-ARC domain-containing protein n=1 Tax=Escallonia rubra TaxID=112253 RepID=A0AA88QJG4_9ASTE|nr:hypothetical protein RJ640_012230 [Escallonia rubra]
MPGQDKTTIAKLICKNDKVVRHFDELIWVSVSDDFEDKRILNEMVQSLTQTNPQLSNMGGILKELQKQVETSDFVEIGREIMKKCRGMPLAIKVVGGLMYSKKSRHEWLSVQDSHLSELLENVTGVIRRILKLSYDHLPSSSLKCCFAYCSILPKDSEINKDN